MDDDDDMCEAEMSIRFIANEQQLNLDEIASSWESN